MIPTNEKQERQDAALAAAEAQALQSEINLKSILDQQTKEAADKADQEQRAYYAEKHQDDAPVAPKAKIIEPGAVKQPNKTDDLSTYLIKWAVTLVSQVGQFTQRMTQERNARLQNFLATHRLRAVPADVKLDENERPLMDDFRNRILAAVPKPRTLGTLGETAEEQSLFTALEPDIQEAHTTISGRFAESVARAQVRAQNHNTAVTQGAADQIGNLHHNFNNDLGGLLRTQLSQLSRLQAEPQNPAHEIDKEALVLQLVRRALTGDTSSHTTSPLLHGLLSNRSVAAAISGAAVDPVPHAGIGMR